MNDGTNDGELKWMDLSTVRPGPIRHDTLPDELLAKIKVIYDQVGRYMEKTLEQFEVGFMYDTHPESEVAVWGAITLAWVDYHTKHLDGELLPAYREKKLIGALAVISMGVHDPKRLGLSTGEARRLIACYKSLFDEDKGADRE